MYSDSFPPLPQSFPCGKTCVTQRDLRRVDLESLGIGDRIVKVQGAAAHFTAKNLFCEALKFFVLAREESPAELSEKAAEQEEAGRRTESGWQKTTDRKNVLLTLRGKNAY